MFLQDKRSGNLVQISDSKALEALFNPSEQEISVRDQQGQEEQDSAKLSKQDLIFPSGEDLPKCWIDANYRTNN